MREIKFRAWDVIERRMVALQGLRFEHDKLYQIMTSPVCPSSEVELMQYTGLKDKDGVEIYEGDIVSCVEQWISKKDDTDIVEENPYHLQVCFVNYQWEFIRFAENENGVVMPTLSLNFPDYKVGLSWGDGFEIWGHGNFDYKQRFRDFEVIGNIYENRELLDDSK